MYLFKDTNENDGIDGVQSHRESSIAPLGDMTGQEVLRVMDWIMAYDKLFHQITDETN